MKNVKETTEGSSAEFKPTSLSPFIMSIVSASATSSRKRKRMVQWDKVVENLVRITIDKQDIVRDLNEALPDAESSLSETHIVQELIRM